MSPLAVRIGAGALALFAILALRRQRWAYLAFVLLGLAYFAVQPHFRVQLPKCELLLPTTQQLVLSLHNYVWIAIFAGFCWMSWVQFRHADLRAIWTIVVTLLMGALVQVAQGMARGGHCRVRDLVPAAAGALGAAVLLAIWARLTRKPGYVRLQRPRAAAAPAPRPAPAPAPPARTVAQPRVIYSPPPPPTDFSPGPVTEPTEAAPTEEVAAPKKVVAPRTSFMQHLQPILERLEPVLGRVRPMLRRIWAMIWGHRRAIIIGVIVLALLGAGAFVVLTLTTATPVATQPPPPPPPEPPPPPPRPLQSEVVGYYEPNYKFSVFDRRFIRLTLRPNASVTFARPGTRQEYECEDAQIGRDRLHLRCALEPYGQVTIEGGFPARYVTAKLDMPVVSALITVTNTRGEVVYRARDSFYWHVPDPEP